MQDPMGSFPNRSKTPVDNKKRQPIKCDRASAIPRERHWAILETGTGTEKGYDRGDPDTSFNFLRYTAYFDKDEWQKEVIRLTEANHKAYTKVDFIAMEVQPAAVNTTVAVSVESLG